jgi:hypothetical protein
MSDTYFQNVNSFLYLFGAVLHGTGFLAISATCKTFYALVTEKTDAQWREICRREWGLEGSAQ